MAGSEQRPAIAILGLGMTAFASTLRRLRALSCHFDFGKADAQRCRYEAARLRVVLRRPPGGVALTDMLSVTPIVPESID